MNQNIRGLDINLAQVAHFEEIAPGDWRGVDIERPSGISIYNREMLITRLANLITAKHFHRLALLNPPAEIYIDDAGNTWIDHEYLAPHQYLPRLIP
jgi:hypothetical protein